MCAQENVPSNVCDTACAGAAQRAMKKQVAPFHRIDLYVIFLIYLFYLGLAPCLAANGSCNDF